MMFGAWRREIEHKLDLIYTALVVRDPGTSMAAEAFEGLRKQVIAGATARHAHVAQLAEFDVALRRGASTDDLLKLTAQWLDQAGVARVDDPTRREAFESTLAPGTPAEVEIPAYVNTVTGQLVRQGRLRERQLPAVERSPSSIEASPAVAAASTSGEPDAAAAAMDAATPVEVGDSTTGAAPFEAAPTLTTPSETTDVTEATEAN